ACEQRVIREYPRQRVRERPWVSRLGDEPGLPIHDGLRNAGNGCGHHRQTNRHRFEDHGRNPILVAVRSNDRRLGEHVRATVEVGGEPVLRRSPQELDPALEILLADQPGETFPFRAFPGNPATEPGPAHYQDRGRLQKDVESLLLHEPPDGEDQRNLAPHDGTSPRPSQGPRLQVETIVDGGDPASRHMESNALQKPPVVLPSAAARGSPLTPGISPAALALPSP